MPRALLATGLVLVALWFLLTSGAPLVDPAGPPTARTVEAGRDAYRRLRASRTAAGGATRISFDETALAGIAALIGDATGVRRVAASVAGERLSAAVSLPMPFGRWLNVTLGVRGSHRGFPGLEVAVGHLDIPRWASRTGAELARWLLRARGVEVLPLDTMVTAVTVGRRTVTADLSLPKRSGLVQGVIGLQGNGVDARTVAQIYCGLATAQRRNPDASLATQVRRAFAKSQDGSPERNRASFVALAFVTVGDLAYDLAPGAVRATRACGELGGPILLAGRPDLAKHWTFSAALTAVLGTDTAGAMGDWKELGDSLPDGSGFSFVDLAADRSGLQAARRATDPGSAAETAAKLANAAEAELFPLSLLAAREGLTEARFLERYGSLDTDRYQATVAWIDRELRGAEGK